MILLKLLCQGVKYFISWKHDFNKLFKFRPLASAPVKAPCAIYNLQLLICLAGTVLKGYFGWKSPRSSCQCSSDTWEAVSPLVGSRCTTLAGYTDKSLKTILFQVLLGLIVEILGLFWLYIINYKEIKIFFHKFVYIKTFHLNIQITCPQNR